MKVMGLNLDCLLKSFLLYVFTWPLKPWRILWNISFKSGFGFCQEAIASQKKMKSLTTPWGLTLIIWHMPLKAESFSSLSLIFLKLVHQGLTKLFKLGATSWGQTKPMRPMVMAVFSNKVLGVLGLFLEKNRSLLGLFWEKICLVKHLKFISRAN